uniref:Nuclear pore glycoprotein p62 n=1 Tax=Podarcis muralis TaxID=64176 RepID=A0A670HLZ3_PODMU
MSQFNFGTPGTPGGGFSFGTPKTAASAAPAGFSFSSATTGGGFSFGTAAQNPASTQPAGLFSFAPPATSAQTSGFSFGTPATSAPAAAGNVFTLGGNAPKLNLSSTNTTQSAGITGALGLGSGGLGTSTPSSAPASQPVAPSGFVFGSNTATQPATTGGFSFGGMGATQAAAPSFSLGSIANTTQQAAPASTGLAFGVPASAAGPTTTTVSTAQPAVAFGLGAQTTGETPSPVQKSSCFLPSVVGVTSTGTAPAGTLGFGAKAPGTTATAPTATATAVGGAPAATTVCWMQVCLLEPRVGVELWAAQLFRHPAHSSCLCRAPPSMTYAQLESLVNKWSLELEDQEKHFLQQATQVNAWDRKLIENGEKITSLHREVEKVKLDQKRLDQELDFILSQQKELEDLLVPLEESVKEQSGTVYLQHADEEREKTYKLAENIDAQLKRMAQDLKDIIEHLNTSGGPADTSDPLQQICKILNAHMDSLQWIDQNSALLQRKVEEVTKVCESRRKEQERSFRITFD